MGYTGLEGELAEEFREILRFQGIQHINIQALILNLEAVIIQHIGDNSYTKSHLAENLGIGRTTLAAKMNKLGIEFP